MLRTSNEQANLPKNNLLVPINISVILPIIGFLGNFIFLTYILKNRVGTRISFILLRIQTVVDATSCLFTIAEILQPRFWTTDNHVFDIIVCYIWHSQFLYWYLINASIYTLVLSVIDRFMFVVMPFKYKKLKLIHLLIALFLVYFLAILHVGAMIIEAGYVNGTKSCGSSFEYYVSLNPNVEYIRLVFSTNWFIFDYLFPTIIIIILYTFVVRALKRSKKRSESNTSNLSVRFTFATLIIAIIMSVSTSYDAIFYLLVTHGLTAANYFDPAYNKIGVILSALNSSVNPYVFILLMPPFRRYTVQFITCGQVTFVKQKQSGAESRTCYDEMKQNRFRQLIKLSSQYESKYGKYKIKHSDENKLSETSPPILDSRCIITIKWKPYYGCTNKGFGIDEDLYRKSKDSFYKTQF